MDRSFSAFLAEHRNGRTDAELADHLRDLIAGVKDTEKAGKLTLVVNVKPNGRGGGSVTVSTSVKVSSPEAAPEASLYYVDDNHNLSRRDPRQLSLTDLRPAQED